MLHSLMLWLFSRRLAPRNGARRPAPRGGRHSRKLWAYRPRLEDLEARTMPSAVVTLLPFLTAPPAGLARPEAGATDAGGRLERPDILGPFGAGANALIDARSAPEQGDAAGLMHAFSTPANDPSVTPDPVSTPTGAFATAGAATSLPAFTLVLDSITFSLDSASRGGTSLLPTAAPAVDHAPAIVEVPSDMVQLGAPATHVLTGATDTAGSELFADGLTTDARSDPAASDGTPAPTVTALRVEVASEVEVGTPAEVVVIALNPANQPAAEYTGTVRFSSSDPSATLPAAFTFGPGDNGVQVATVIFANAGSQTLAVSDGANALRDIVTVWVRRSVGRRRNQRNRDVLDIWLAS